MTRVPGTIAVDLTPLLPGGENGGAKIFVLELLRQLAELAPQTRFVLLTQHSSHDELAFLDRPNMERRMVIGASAAQALRPRMVRIGARVLRHLPGRARRLLTRVGYRLNTALKRGGSGRTLLRDLNADLLYCPFTAPTYAEPGIPVVCTIHDLQYKTYPEFFSVEDVAHRDRAFMDAARRATMLAAVSEYSRQTAIVHGNVDPARIKAIHLRMAQRTLATEGDSSPVLARLGLASGRYLIYPANFWKHKNHEMLFTAFGMACAGGLPGDIKLVCTGAPGTRQAWLEQAAQAMGIGERIVFPGFLPTAEFAALMSNSCAVVFPSLYEGFGLPVIEAMASGKPVACSNGTSLPEVAADAAHLFDPRIPEQIAQAMMTLVMDAALRARLVEAGKKRAAEFADSRRMAKEYWQLFQQALASAAHEDLLSGVFEDGWMGPGLLLQAAPHARAQTAEFEFHAPASIPFGSVTINAYSSGQAIATPLQLARDSSASWSLPLPPTGACYEIRAEPAFVPQHFGLSADTRKVSVILLDCSIRREGSERTELFTAKQPA
jgi:glycosyltransferase involved in cell wall biosynthesis